METIHVDIAVVGSGIAGLGAAWSLAPRATMSPSSRPMRRLGGHAHTVDIEDRGRDVAVDTGFIVYNERNYPNLVRLFEHLRVPTEPSDMSFSVSKGGGAFEYQARALGLLAQPTNLARRGYRRMVADILRFTREAPAAALQRDGETTRELLDRMALSEEFRRDFLLPVIACIWSSSLEAMLDYPARSMAALPRQPRPPRCAGATEVEDRDGREPRVRRTRVRVAGAHGYATKPPWSGWCGAPTASRSTPLRDARACSITSSLRRTRTHRWESSATTPTLTSARSCRRSDIKTTSPCCIAIHPSCRPVGAPGRAGTTSRKNERRTGASASRSPTG